MLFLEQVIPTEHTFLVLFLSPVPVVPQLFQQFALDEPRNRLMQLRDREL